MIKKLLFAMVITAVAGNAYAETTTQTVTTQNYVDSQVATKQDKIAAHSTGALYPDSVITDTTTDGTVAKRLIVEPGVLRMNETIMVMGLENGSLVNTLGNRANVIGLTENDVKNGVISAGVINSAFAGHHEMIWARQKNKVCVRYIDGAEETSENCLLWNLPD